MPPMTDASTAALLLRALVDDAAVFPPGNAPLAEAVAGHAVHRSAWYADAVGPLLVPAASVADLVRVLDAAGCRRAPGGAADPLALVLIARPGADPATTTAALDALRDEVRVRVVGVELGWQEGWRDLGLDDLAVALEVPRGPTTRWPSPTCARALAQGWPGRREVPHRPHPHVGLARRGRARVVPPPRRPRGAVQARPAGCTTPCAAATRWAASPRRTTACSTCWSPPPPRSPTPVRTRSPPCSPCRDATALADLVAAWPDDTATRVREAFTAYGCCTVTDPVGELADLGLLARP